SAWVVYLDTNNNNMLDSGETKTISDAAGNYAFKTIPAGSYFVRQVLKSGYRKTLPGSGVPGYDVTISAGNAVTGKDFGVTTHALIKGYVFNDSNSNGIKD